MTDKRVKHGLGGRASRVPEFNVWCKMRQRCASPASRDYKNYGARGIQACPEWLTNFAAFYIDMGPRPTAQHTLERLNNDLGYSKENCIWATRAVQNKNRRKRVAMQQCRRGHQLDADNGYLRPDGKRGCRTCRALNMKAYYARKVDAHASN